MIFSARCRVRSKHKASAQGDSSAGLRTCRPCHPAVFSSCFSGSGLQLKVTASFTFSIFASVTDPPNSPSRTHGISSLAVTVNFEDFTRITSLFSCSGNRSRPLIIFGRSAGVFGVRINTPSNRPSWKETSFGASPLKLRHLWCSSPFRKRTLHPSHRHPMSNASCRI